MSTSDSVRTLVRAFLWEVPKVIFAPLILVGGIVATVFRMSFGWTFELFRNDRP